MSRDVNEAFQPARFFGWLALIEIALAGLSVFFIGALGAADLLEIGMRAATQSLDSFHPEAPEDSWIFAPVALLGLAVLHGALWLVARRKGLRPKVYRRILLAQAAIGTVLVVAMVWVQLFGYAAIAALLTILSLLALL